MKLFISIEILYAFLLIIMMVMQQPPTQYNEEVVSQKEVEKNDFIVTTDKQVYEYGESIEVEVTRDLSDVKDNQQFGEYISGSCGLEVSKINDSSFPDLNCSNRYSCKYYCNKFRFLIESLETKKLVWDQEACFGTSWYGDPVTPGDYVVGIDCDTNLSSNKVNIKIKEPPLTSCANKKKLELKKVTHNAEKNVVMEIQNNSNSDIENIGIKKVCERTAITDSMKDAKLEGLKVGERKEYSIDHSCTELYILKIYPYECLSDRDMVSYDYYADGRHKLNE